MRDRPALRALPMVGILLGPFAALLVVMAVRGIPMGAGAVSIADRSRAVRFGSDTFAWAPDTFAPLLPFLTAAAGSRPVVPVAATAVLVAVTLAVVVRVLLRNGVHRAHILDGRIPHVVLLELLTDAGVGTMITRVDGGWS